MSLIDIFWHILLFVDSVSDFSHPFPMWKRQTNQYANNLKYVRFI